MYISIYVNAFMCMCVYMHMCIFEYVYMCISVYVYMCTCVYVYMCILQLPRAKKQTQTSTTQAPRSLENKPKHET